MSTLQQNWRKKQNRFCLEVRAVGEVVGGKRKRVGGGEGWVEEGGRNGPNNVCTYE
jgi:hypothetical protein